MKSHGQIPIPYEGKALELVHFLFNFYLFYFFKRENFSLIRATYALTMSPVAMSLEELIPSNHSKSYVYAILIRTALVISTLLVGLTVPFFGKSWASI